MFDSKDPCLGHSKLPLAGARKLTGRALRRYRDEEDGTLLIFGVYIFVLILMVGGIGIDLMRIERDRSKLQYTLDRAVLAAADLDQELDPKAVVRDYFEKSNMDAYLGAITVDEGLGYRTVSADANAEVRTQFMHMTGLDTLSAPAIGTAEERIGTLEVVMVLDVSGSMNRNNRLVNLKVAAKEFVDKILDQSRAGSVSISIVPYATQVNAGEPLLSKFPNVTAEHNYSHCVNFIENQYKKTDIGVTEILERTAHFDPFTYSESPIAMPVCPIRAGTAIVAHTNVRQQLHDAIDAMSASGNTSIDVGMKWGAALLDPDLRPVVTGLVNDGIVPAEFNGKPANFNDGQTLKVIVVMSDGQNTDQYFLNPSMRDTMSNVWYNATTGHYSVYRDNGNRFFWPTINDWVDWPYGNNPDGSEPGTAVRLSYPELYNQTSLAWNARYNYYFQGNAWTEYYRNAFSKRETSAKNQYTKHICGAAKDQDVIVFAIGFEAPKVGVATLKDCASSASHYFDADGLEISEAFDSVATSIRKLRLTQ